MFLSRRLRAAVTNLHPHPAVERQRHAEKAARRRPRHRSLLHIEELEDRTVFNAGGGFTGGGILGQYYANITNPTDWLNNMANYTPAFSRTDVRIDFTNSSQALTSAPGGVPQDVNYATVGSTNFAVHWTGSFIPKYTETYIFKTITDDGVVLKIDGNTIINDFTDHGPTTDTNSIALTAGQTYTIEMDYFQAGGGWNAQLHWLSADTKSNDPGYFAEEAIEPATPVGVNYEADPKAFADVVKFASYSSATTTNPADGWPTEDFRLTLFYGGGEYGQDDQGTYLLQFNGEAQVTDAWGPNLDFQAGGTDYGATLPFGAGFNSSTGMTTATVTIPDISPWGYIELGFTQTQRDGGGGGVTNIHLMRPTTAGGTTDYAVGTLLTQAGLAEAAPFTALRMMDWTSTNGNDEVNWSDRALPGANFWEQTADGAMSWETAVAVANATGKDIYINIPTDASNAYITDLADLFKYGSDGVNPYTSLQTDPVWAPLDSNLNVYIEYSNEVWNWGSPVYGQVNNLVLQNEQNDTADWQLFSSAGGWVNTNSSGQATSSDTTVWTLVRDVDISNIFRQVYGDAAMPANAQGVVNPDPRIRLVFEWQYGGGWNGGSGNSSDQAMRALEAQLPQAINYYIWGGGGGWYADETTGGFSDVQFANPNFDGGTDDWTFSSSAGVVANGSSMGNPNSPTEVAPSSPAKTTTNAVYLQPGASITQSVYFSGGYADLTFYATQTAANNWYNGLEVSIDGQSIAQSEGAPLYSGSQDSWAWDRTAAFDTGASAGWHTITFTNTWGIGSGVDVFLDNFGIQTVNGLFNEVAASGQPSITSVQSDVAIDLQFGLHDVGYEGGFDFNQNLGYDDINGYSDMGAKGYSSGTPNVAMYANLDPRTVSLAINTITQFYQDGGALPFIFQSTGNINSWAVVAPTLYSALDETTSVPKVEAVVTMGQSLSPTPTYGTPAPGSVAAPAYDWQSPGSRLNETFLVGAPGTYNVGFTIGALNNGSTGTLQILVDGQLLGSVNVNDANGGPYTLPAYLSGGQHSVTIVDTAEASGPYFGLLLAGVTVQGTGEVNLSSNYNQTGIYVDNSTFSSTGGFAGDNFGISSNVLGNGVIWNGQPFSFGPGNANDVVSAAGQTIALPQSNAGALYFLGAAVYGNQINQTFTVTYTDGSQQTFTQSMSDWYNGLQGFTGEAVAVAMPYADLANDSKFYHSSFYLYGYSFALDANKTVQSITLPDNSHVKIVAMTLSPTAPAEQVDLSSTFNKVGIVNDGSTFSGGLDNDGNALSANWLNGSVVWNNQQYALGATGSNNVVQASGQTIALPQGNYSTLSFLASGVNGNQPNLTFTVTYTDGTMQTFTQSISDWYTPQNYSGESIAVTTPYRDTSSGGKDQRSFNIYGYSFALNASKTVQSITLPDDGNAELLAIDLS